MSMHFLIADDHDIVRRGLRETLSDEYPDSTFGEARNSQQVLSLVWAQTWDLVVLDINMPGRSGLEVLPELKQARPGLPVLVLSMYPEADFAVRALKSGASGYLTKQSASDELVAAVRKVLSGGMYVTAVLAERLAANLKSGESSAPHEHLSNREIQVLRLIAAGKSTKEIADELSLSPKTVGTYRTRIQDKTGLRSSVDMARYALQHKLVD